MDWSACQLLENLAWLDEQAGLPAGHLEAGSPPASRRSCCAILRWLISNEKAFMLMRQFGFHGHECIEVKEATPSPLASTPSPLWARLWFWPEAMVTSTSPTASSFRRRLRHLRALDGKLFAEVDFERDWLDDARRYLTNIVGKYGTPSSSC